MKKRSNILIVIFSCLFAIYCCELLLGFVFVKSLRLYPVPPHSQHELISLDYHIHFDVNNLSLRGDNIDFKTLYDIALYGDSFIFGAGVHEDKIVYGHLKKQGLKGVNIAEEATHVPQYYDKFQLLKHHGFKAKHHVLCVFLGNDFSDITPKDITPLLNYKYSSYPLDYTFVSFLKLKRITYLLKVVYYKKCTDAIFVHEFRHKKQALKVVVNRTYTPLTEAEYLKKSEINKTSVQKNATIINAMKEVTPAKQKFSVLLIPDQHFTKGELKEAYLQLKNNFIEQLDESIAIWDLHPIMKTEMYFPKDGHWNEKGHERVADFILEKIASEENK